MPWPEELVTGFMGLAIPFGLSWTAKPLQLRRSSKDQEFLTSIPTIIWILLILFVIVFRFYKLTTLSVWPCYDEGFINYYAFELSQKWDWRMVYGSSQAPPAYIWCQSFFFKCFGPSLQTLWFFPALISTLTTFLAYAAARSFFSKSISFLLFLLMTGSFWPLYIGRFSLMTALIPFWECLSLWLLGIFFNSPAGQQKLWVILLGFVIGTGFYIHLSWIPIAAMTGLAVLAFGWKKKDGFLFFCFFLSAVGGVLLPLIMAVFRQSYGLYIKDLWAFSKSAPIHNQLQVSLGYYSCLLWGSDDDFHPFEPVWGGFFNPILGSLFLLGLLRILKNKYRPLETWLLIALVVFIVPESLTKTLEPFRIIPVMVPLFVVMVYGLRELLTYIPERKRWVVVAGILMLSWGLDFYHLTGPYQNIWKTPQIWGNYIKSVVQSRAYNRLEEWHLKEGPGLVFSNFITGFSDETLDLADYSFNAADNPSLSWDKASWVAVLTNVHYQPFLKKRFPDGQAFFLSKDISAANGGDMLWIMPVTPEKKAVLKQWEKASQALKPFIDQYISYVSGSSFQPVGDTFFRVQPDFTNDPFLESIFWEKVADNELKMNDPDHRFAIQALQEALQKGYPAAHLYYDLGMFYWMNQNKEKARWAFQKATQSSFDFTNSGQMLKEL